LTDRVKISLVYIITSLFIILNTWLVVNKEYYWGIFIPLAIMLVLLYIYKFEKAFFLAVLSTPLAVNIGNYDLGISISIPSEPLLLGVLLIFALKVIIEGYPDKRILRHPVTVIILISLLWMFIASCTSVRPVVSFKYFAARLWFVIPMFFLGAVLFKDIKKAKTFGWAYVLPLIIVIAITTIEHWQYGFSEKAGHWVMQPFYNDHTAYGAILSLFLPLIIGFAFDRKSTPVNRTISIITTLILLGALYLSFSRAAWVSVAFAAGVLILILLKIKFRWIAMTVVVLLAVFFTFKFEILDKLEKNKQDASANFIEHIESISNISSDASNLERINRWQSALRMYHEKPVFGWGPGTYQFEYAPYQSSREKTIISTNLGDLGNAHSEYIGPLAETGLPGFLIVIALMITVIYTGLKVYRKATDHQVKLLALTITLGLVTYYVHGVMNNFLDTDKASVPFWGFIAILVALDIYSEKQEKQDTIPAAESDAAVTEPKVQE
jgi:O-antigen ligase